MKSNSIVQSKKGQSLFRLLKILGKSNKCKRTRTYQRKVQFLFFLLCIDSGKKLVDQQDRHEPNPTCKRSGGRVTNHCHRECGNVASNVRFYPHFRFEMDQHWDAAMVKLTSLHSLDQKLASINFVSPAKLHIFKSPNHNEK